MTSQLVSLGLAFGCASPSYCRILPLPTWVVYMSQVRVEFVLTAVVAIGALSIDMTLPSLPATAEALGARPPPRS